MDGTNLVGVIRLDDLEASEQVIVRIDVKLACKGYASPTGNLQATLSKAQVVQPAVSTINVGAQTIPFKQVGQIAGAGVPVLRLFKTVTTPDGACPGVEQLSAVEHDAVKYCYVLRNDGTFDAENTTLVDDNGTPADASDDFAVSLSGLSTRGALLAGAVATGEAIVEAHLRGGATLTNVAKASGKSSGSTYTDSDTATVNVTPAPFVYHPSLSVSTTVSTTGTCPGSELVTVLSGTGVTFCYTVTNTGDIGVGGIQVTAALGGTVNAPPFDLAPGESNTVSWSTSTDDDLAELAVATGFDGAAFQPVSSSEDGAAVDVVPPLGSHRHHGQPRWLLPRCGSCCGRGWFERVVLLRRHEHRR